MAQAQARVRMVGRGCRMHWDRSVRAVGLVAHVLGCGVTGQETRVLLAVQ